MTTKSEKSFVFTGWHMVVTMVLFFGTINWTHTWFDPKGAVSAGALAQMAVDLTLGGVRKAAE